MRWPHLSRRLQRPSRRRLRFEPLEGRRLMADLAIGVTVVDAAMDNDLHDSTINVGKVGSEFTLQVQVRDLTQRALADMGVIALPLNISWDPEFVSLVQAPNSGQIQLGNPLLTDAFQLQRFLQGFDANVGPVDHTLPTPLTPADFNLQGLRGAALPKFGRGMAIGINGEDVFSKLRFTAKKVTTDPNQALFTIRLAGSMSFADASVLEPLVRGSNTQVVDDITVQTHLQVDPVIISGMKFKDANMNGVKDDGELGLDKWTIQLIRDQDNNGAIDPTDPVRTTTTDADGAYTFEVTEPDTYFVREVQQAGCNQTTPDPAPIPISGVDVAGVDFGNSCGGPMNSLSGFVFADTNLNGKFESGEDGLPNVTVQLLRTDVVNVPAATVLTGPDGWYHFEDLPAGTYEIREEQPQGFVNSINSLGILCGATACLPATDVRNGAVNGDRFTGITLQAGEHGVDYNFGDNIIPTKRRFVASVDPFAETCRVLGLNCVTVRGTNGNDQIEFVPDTEVVRVTVNNQPAQVFSRDTVNIVKIDALAGQDTVTLRGGSANDVAHSQSNSCTIQTGSYRAGDYAVLAVNAERTIVDGGLGNDLAVLRDSAVDEVLTATNEPFIGPVTELESALNMTRFVRAIAFERTRAVSVPYIGVNDTDTAISNGLPLELVGKWQS